MAKKEAHNKYSRREFLKQAGWTGYFLGTRTGIGYIAGKLLDDGKKFYEETIHQSGIRPFFDRLRKSQREKEKKKTISDKVLGVVYQRPVESMTAAGLAAGSFAAAADYARKGNERKIANALDSVNAIEARLTALEEQYFSREEHGVELILAGFVGVFLAFFLKTLSSYKTGLAVSELANLREPGIVGLMIVFSILILAYGLFKKRSNKILKEQVALRKKLILGN